MKSLKRFLLDKKKNVRVEILLGIVTLAVPTVIEQILGTVVQYVDTAMVGRLGEEATAAVSTTTTINWLLGSLLSAFGVGLLAMISKSAGEKNERQMKKLAVIALWLTAALGLLESVLACALSPFIPVWMGAEEGIRQQASRYFLIISIPLLFRAATTIFGAAIRAVKDTKTPMIINLSVNVLNIVLNYLLIYRLGMGVTGAATASAISFAFGGTCMFLAFCKKKEFSRKGECRLPDFSVFRKCMDISIPVMMTSLTSCVGYIVFAGLVARMGTTTFAAHSIAVTAEQLFYIPGYGMSTAVAALIGFALGERNRERFEIIWKQAVCMTVGLMCLSGVVLYLASDWLMGVFTPSGPVILLGARMLRIVAFSEPFFGLMIIMQGIYNGLGRTRYSFVIETLSMWGIRILLSALCVNVWKLELQAVWYCMVADNVTKALLYFVRFALPGQREKLWSRPV